MRQLIAARLSAWKMRRQIISPHIDGGNKTTGDTAVAHVSNQRINSRLPFRLRNTRSNFIVGNDTRITFRERDEDHNSRAIFSSPNPTAGKLLHGNAMSDGAARLTWHKRNPYARQTKKHQKR